MKNILKQIISFILPITVLIIVPFIIEKDISVKHLSFLLVGLLFMIVGLSLMIITITSFIKIGKGTLAPWSPTKKLVIIGIFRHVRNPMIIGVIMILTGESIAIESLKIFIWAIIFFVLNTIYFILYEEPNLEKRFGNEYKDYKKNVPRWIPKIKPFIPLNSQPDILKKKQTRQ